MRLVTVTLILLSICIPAEAQGKNNSLTESAITDMYIKAVDFTLAGNLKDGEAYFEDAYSNLKKGASPELEMKLLRRLLEYDDFNESFLKLIEHGESLEKLAIQENDPFYMTIAYAGMAKAYFYLTEDYKVNEMLDKAVSFSATEETRWIKGYASALRADIEADYRNYARASELYEDSLTDLRYEPADNLILQHYVTYRAKHIKNMAESEQITGAEALNLFSDFKPEAEAADTRILMKIQTMQYDGEISTMAGNYNEAINSFDEAEKMLSLVVDTSRGSLSDYEKYLKKMKAEAAYKSKDYKMAADLYYYLANAQYSITSQEYSEDIKLFRELEEKENLDQIELLESLDAERQQKLRQQEFFIALLSIMLLMIAGIGITLIKNFKHTECLKNRLYIESVTDDLTQIYNRRKIIDLLQENLDSRGVVALLDIDYFKIINDTYGHSAGAKVLVEVSSIIKSTLISCDHVGRYGGEEFLIIIKDVSLEQGVAICERIRESIENHEWSIDGLRTSVSIGLSEITGNHTDSIVNKADELLYKSKSNGRNQLAYENL